MDPNTAHSQLILSEDMTSIIQHSHQKQELPDNPERFDEIPGVMGSEGFDSGKHCWEVEIGEGNGWGLGVRTAASQRKGRFMSCSGIWGVSQSEDGKNYSAESPSRSYACLKVKQRPRKIRVELNCDKGKLTFSDPDNKANLHSFSHSFTDKVFPFFFGKVALRIVPVKVAVTLENV